MNFSPELSNEEKKVRECLDSEFYGKNDKAHMINHIDDVWRETCELINEHAIEVKREVIFLGVYLHDIYSGPYRKVHNILAKDFVMNAWRRDVEYLNMLVTLEEHELQQVAEMVYWHRSSLHPEEDWFTEKEWELINLIRAADKGRPIFKIWLERARKYHGDEKDAVENMKKHFLEKYVPEGYIWKDEEYKKLYINDYTTFQKDLKEWLKNN